MDFRLWPPLSFVTSRSLRDKIQLAYVFGSQGHCALMITEDDEVLACGTNEHGCLGSDQESQSSTPVSVAALQGKGVKGFSCGHGSTGTFMMAYTNSGEVYKWGILIGEDDRYQTAATKSFGKPFHNSRSLLPPTIIFTPTLVTSFSLESVKISEVASGTNHCLALSVEGKVYSWGLNNAGQLGNGTQKRSVDPVLVQSCLENQRVVKISCGDNFSVILLDNGKVYSWGINNYGQLGLSNATPFVSLPSKVPGLNDIVIKDLVCGIAHTLIITIVGVVYGWGKNTRGELGIGDNESHSVAEIIPTVEKFVDIAAVCKCPISAAMNDKSEVFMWGDFSDFIYSTPKKTPYKSIQEVFAFFASPRIMSKPVVRQIQSKSKIVPSEKLLNDQVSSDLTIIARDKTQNYKKIYVHQNILNLRSDYFRSMFVGERWVGKLFRVIEVDEGYEVIRSYLQYIYTGEIKADPDVAPELLTLADKYQDLTFKDLCEECLDFNISVNNVASLFNLALTLNATKLQGKCITFAGRHMSDVLLTQAACEWDTDTMREFVVQCKKRKLFRS